MASIPGACQSIYALVKALGTSISELDSKCGLVEESRKLHRQLKRVEVLVSDIEPYLSGVRVWVALREIEATLSALLQLFHDVGSKGPLVVYLQADRTLSRFGVAASRLDLALARLQEEAGGAGGSGDGDGSSSGSAGGGSSAPGLRLADETREEMCCVRQLLQRTRFQLPAAHEANLQRYRTSVDSLQGHFAAMVKSCGEMLQHTMQAPLLSKEAFYEAVGELQAEVELQQQLITQAGPLPASASSCAARSGGVRGSATAAGSCSSPLQGPQQGPVAQEMQPQQDMQPPQTLQAAAAAARRVEVARRVEREEQYLRMMMDVVRAHHAHPECDAPLEFLCPLTHHLMQEPVVLHDTGHSYERRALEEWWAKGHHFCPRTGLHLRRLSTSPNHNLRSAIERWRLHSEMQLSFRPVLDSLVKERTQRQQQNQQHKAAAVAAAAGVGAASGALSAAQLVERLQRVALLDAAPEQQQEEEEAQGHASKGCGEEAEVVMLGAPVVAVAEPIGAQLSLPALVAAAAAVQAGSSFSCGGDVGVSGGNGGTACDAVGADPVGAACSSEGGVGGGHCSPRIDTPQRAGSLLLDCADSSSALSSLGGAPTVATAAHVVGWAAEKLGLGGVDGVLRGGGGDSSCLVSLSRPGSGACGVVGGGASELSGGLGTVQGGRDGDGGGGRGGSGKRFSIADIASEREDAGAGLGGLGPKGLGGGGAWAEALFVEVAQKQLRGGVTVCQ